MQNFQVSPARSLLTVLLLICATAFSACAQEKAKRMVRGPSVTVLVPESPNEKEDGISQIIFAQIFKEGETEYTQTGSSALRNAPPFPTGHVLFKNLVFHVKTQAVTAGSKLTVFKLPSVENETDFNRLSILHLEDDEMSPSGRSWAPVLVFQDGWQEQFHGMISKSQYEAVLPDYASKRLSAITSQLGMFAVTFAPESDSRTTGPFTQIEVTTSSSPQPVAIGEEITHTILIKNKGSRAAAEVNLKAELDPTFNYAPQSDQGNCKRSTQSSGRMLCYLGAMPSGSTATITMVGRISPNTLLTKEISEFGNMLEIVFKANPTDLVDMDSQIFMQFDFKVVKKQ